MPSNSDHRQWLEQAMQLFPRLPDDAQAVVLRFIPAFLKGKEFEGLNGLTVTDEHKVLIAANAALVGAAQRVSCFASVRWVLLYPNIVHLDGEAFYNSKVVLSWQCVAEESRDPGGTGSNLVVHEFAHILDGLLGISHGTEGMREAFEQAQAAEVAGEEIPFRFEDLENPQEFFASASEVFFTRPNWLQADYPALYDDLAGIYGLDTAAFLDD